MSNSRFLLTNLLADPNAYVENGIGLNAPARTEVSPYLMERAMDSDRMTVWKGGGGLDFDIGLDAVSANAVSAAAVLGIGNTGITNVKVFSRAAYYGAAGYGGGGWIQRGGTMTTTGLRDLGISFDAVSDDFWRFQMFTGGYIVGTLWLGPVTDLGILYSPTSQSSPNRSRIEQRYADGSMVINDLGPPGRDIRLLFANVRQSMADTLEALADQPGSFVYLDPRGRAHEVICPNGAVSVVQNFIDNYTVEVNLVKLS